MSHPDPTPSGTPAWPDFWKQVGSEEWLAAKALLELDTYGTVRNDAGHHLAYPAQPYRTVNEDGERCWAIVMDWEGWVADVDEHGRGWSSTERRLFHLVAALTTGRPLNIIGVLDQMNSWEHDVWRILVDWGTGGNNRDRRGRSAVVPA